MKEKSENGGDAAETQRRKSTRERARESVQSVERGTERRILGNRRRKQRKNGSSC